MKRLNKQVIGFENNRGGVGPRPQATAGIPTATRRPVVVGAGEGVTVTSFAPFLPPSAPHEHGANVSARWAWPVLPPQMVTVVLLVGTFRFQET